MVESHIAITMIEKLATNMTMEVNAATSLIKSVIGPLLTCYVSYMFYLCSPVNCYFEESVAIATEETKTDGTSLRSLYVLYSANGICNSTL